MSDHPYATKILLEVMGVAGEDALLPLPVLVNLHRKELQAPLLSLGARLESYMARWPESGTLSMQRLLKRLSLEWPALKDGNIFRESPTDLGALPSHIPDALDSELRRTSPGTQVLLGYTLGSWLAYEPLALLHQLTWPESPREKVLAMLEADLRLDPAVEQIIRHYTRTHNWHRVVR